MNHCARCLYPENHPLGITFDKDGVCSGCRIHEEKDQLDWSSRLETLKKITRNYKNITRSSHDCIIPISGARDSYFIVDFVVNELKLKPLLVNYNSHYNTRMGIRNMSYLKTLLGVDFLQCTVSPHRVKKITRETLKLMGSMYWHILAGQTVFPVRVAVQHKIPLIIWGAHQGIDQVGMFSHLDEVEMTRKYRKEHDLMGFEAEDLLAMDNFLDSSDLEQYFYPSDKELAVVGVRGIYLNNYVRWDSKKQHELMIRKYGYETMSQQRTFDTYNDVDSFHYSGIHDEIKMIKHGYGKVSDHVAREIRLKRMTYEEGADKVNTYKSKKPKDLNLFLDWIEMDETEYYSIINKFRLVNNETENKINEKINSLDTQIIDKARLVKKEECNFQLNDSRQPDIPEDKYILIGRGWAD